MTNILEAICNITRQQNFKIKEFYHSKNRANNMGEALEQFIKDSLVNSFNIDDEQERLKIFAQEFSWLGNQNHPPDLIIRGGDAIEVKKTESEKSDLALNSSYPKAKLFSTSNMITKECKECENWSIKDIIYCVGHVKGNDLKSLWIVYGNIYAAKQETYEKIKSNITEGINSIENIDFAETDELGRVNRVDPLGITNLRIRGMWQIQNPRRVFGYLHSSKHDNFELVCIIPEEKYISFDINSRNNLNNMIGNNLKISDVNVKDPNNPANLISCKLIIYQNK